MVKQDTKCILEALLGDELRLKGDDISLDTL